MKAITYHRYGPPSVLSMTQVATPKPAKGQVLVRVHASSVSTADWRLRAAAFPGVMQIPGRLMFGLCGPRKSVLGMDFSGEVVGVAPGVTRFKPGDRVIGFAGKGGHAEYLTIDQGAAIAHLPDALSHQQAAALPWGGLSALVFLRDFANVQPGQKVMVIGGSGGVGIYAVQIARAMGAKVTAVAGGANQTLLRDLGAMEARDYKAGPSLRDGDAFDVILDTVGAVNYAQALRALADHGVFIPLNFGLREIGQALMPAKRARTRIKIGVSEDKRDDLETLLNMVAQGQVRPVIDQVFPMEQAAHAHAYVEGRHRKGAVILEVLQTQKASAA